MTFKLQIVEWLDHVGDTSWQSLEDVCKAGPSKSRTVGWLIHEDNQCIRMVSSIPGDERKEFGGLDVILKSCITSRRTLRA